MPPKPKPRRSSTCESAPPAPGSTARAPARPRFELVDVARGVAILQMVAYHLCYDLNFFGWVRIALTEDAVWVAWRTAIVTQFLFLVGVSLALRVQTAATRAQFWRRWAQIAGCAALVSLASAYLFGARLIWFGVLHFVALVQLLLAPVVRLRWINIGLAVAALALGLTVELPAFGANAWSWIGFSPVKPHTEDFVPLFPWLGVVLLGLGATNLWLHRHTLGSATLSMGWLHKRNPGPAMLSMDERSGPAMLSIDERSGPASLSIDERSSASRPAPARGYKGFAPVAVLGRWPLTVYMLHQPLLFGVFYLLAQR